MPHSLYEVTIPMFIRELRIVSSLLQHGADYASTTATTEEALLSARLIADMQPLAFQIHRLSDIAAAVALYLADVPSPKLPNENTKSTIPELRTHCALTITFLESLTPEQFSGAEEKLVEQGDRMVTGWQVVEEWALPNFFFHVVTIYALLRMKGVPIGKGDYLGVKSGRDGE